ncbi:MAG: hypothetical protein KGM24_15130 [Elusimicrobia bacterium]|nr:hypothetical protein [Elusimicrobiota bacterium]
MGAAKRRRKGAGDVLGTVVPSRWNWTFAPAAIYFVFWFLGALAFILPGWGPYVAGWYVGYALALSLPSAWILGPRVWANPFAAYLTLLWATLPVYLAAGVLAAFQKKARRRWALFAGVILLLGGAGYLRVRAALPPGW